MEQNASFQQMFADVFEKNGLQTYIKDEIVEQFRRLTDIMLETNRVMNVTALTTLDKILPLHYADCVLMAQYIPEGASVIDIGCGGGFPILPLAIVRPDLRLTGLDSTDKKVRYVAETAQKLGLSIQTVSARAEELARLPDQREQYDVAISRAVARLNLLNELCLPFVQVGGRFLAMKGAAGDEELAECATGIHKLGGERPQIEHYSLHLTDTAESRTLVAIFKERTTPSAYPRAFGAIKKKPL